MSNNNAQPVYWTQRNGQQINVDHMTVDHLRNTLKMIIRNSKPINVKVKDSTPNIFKLRGDIANNFNNTHPSTDEDELWNLYSEEFHSKY